VLITISGMVGSGKSTTAATVADLLVAAGLTPRYLRFRYLRLCGFARPQRAESGKPAPADAKKARAEGFALRPLTAALTAGYAVRILAFRLSGIGRGARCDVLDRYFYDNLVHYALRSRRERVYAAILRRLIPAPDLAILVVASDETIGCRRSNYAREYIVSAGRRYRELPDLFPRLTTIRTDPESSPDEAIRNAVQRLLAYDRVASALSRTPVTPRPSDR
jgi:thymidylate kinase